MFMKLIELNKEKLDSFLANQDKSQFLQSFAWGEFQEKTGFEVFRYGVEGDGELVAVVSLIKKSLGMRKSYFYAPRGPVFNFQFSISNFQTISNDQNSKIKKYYNFLFDEIGKMAKKESCIFLRFEPQRKSKVARLPDGQESRKSKVIKTIDLQPAKTLMLDLGKSEEELLQDMHQKTRYNIRLAEKKGVEVVEVDYPPRPDGHPSREGNLFEEFWKLMSQTGGRDGFRLHSKNYYKKMLDESKVYKVESRKSEVDLSIKLFLAKYQGEVIAGNIISFFGDTVTYMHGASSNEYRNVMAPYILQWEVIKAAKEKGYKYYDFFGIDKDKWPGVTRFKEGFCVKNLEKCQVTYPGTFDLVFSKVWYNAYNILRRIRRVL